MPSYGMLSTLLGTSEKSCFFLFKKVKVVEILEAPLISSGACAQQKNKMSPPECRGSLSSWKWHVTATQQIVVHEPL